MTSTAAIYLPIAKKHGVKCTIAHARSAGVDPGLKGMLTKWLRRDLYQKTDVCFACSKEAAISVFGRPKYEKGEVRILPNAVELGQYQEADEMEAHAQVIKKKYDLQNAFVIGHVGRFHYAKNHVFLLNVFSEIHKQDANTVLLLAGDGELRPEIERQISELDLKKDVLLLGSRSDVPKLLMSADCCLFPSVWEGFGMVAVEAQAAGLPCICSDAIPQSVKVTEHCIFISTENAQTWAGKALAFALNANKLSRNAIQSVIDNGFDINNSSEKLCSFYQVNWGGV